MTIQAWKTSFIGINKPAKVVPGSASAFVADALWPHANGVTDPYWAGGINPRPYRWVVTFSVDVTGHGSHLTRTPFQFNANDIDVGDFVAGADDGKVCEIMSILTKNDFTLTAIVEDRLRYNTFRSPTGDGLFTCPGNVIFFQINELGFPMIDPVPSVASSTFADNVTSRFQYMNPLTNYVLEKNSHGFQQGDAICIEDGQFVLSDADNIGKFIGTVVYPGPGPHQFILRPANGIIDFIPNLPGYVGDYIYPSIDGSGDLTTSDISRRPVFLKIANATPTYTLGNAIIIDRSAEGDVININGIEIPISYSTLDEVISLINAHTTSHRIVASKVNAAVHMKTIATNLALGVIAGAVPFVAMINGVQVSFTTTTSGRITFSPPPDLCDVYDMVTDINATGIENIVASVADTGELVVTHLTGGSIHIDVATPGVFAGPNSFSGLPIDVAANTETWVLKLTDVNGGPMTLRDVQGQYLTSVGVISGQNGRYAIGLNIEQGLRSSATTVVANIVARDALHALVGDQCYVINDGHDEWATFIYDASTWVKVAGKRAVEVDARTMLAEVLLPTPAAGIILGTVTEDRRILNISVTVLEELIGISNFSVYINDDTTTENLLWEKNQHGANELGTYCIETNHISQGYNNIFMNFEEPYSTSSSGKIKVEVTYI